MGLCLGGSDKEADFHSAKGKFFSRQKYPAMERAADDEMSSPLSEVFKHSALSGQLVSLQQWSLNLAMCENHPVSLLNNTLWAKLQ